MDEPVKEMALPVIDAIRTLQPLALPVVVVVDHKGQAVKITSREDIVGPARAAVGIVVGSYAISITLQAM